MLLIMLELTKEYSVAADKKHRLRSSIQLFIEGRHLHFIFKIRDDAQPADNSISLLLFDILHEQARKSLDLDIGHIFDAFLQKLQRSSSVKVDFCYCRQLRPV